MTLRAPHAPDRTSATAGRAAPATEPLVEVVIVAFRGQEVLGRCLDSLRSHPPSDGALAIHVVDNASGDGTAEFVEREFPEVSLHRQTANGGFSVANNVALRVVRAPYVLVLNPDTELRAGLLDHLIRELEAHPDVGVIGCRLERLDGSFDHAAKRRFPTPIGALEHFVKGWKMSGRADAPAYHAPEVSERGVGTVDAVNGAFMLIRRAALRDTGLFDERYWMYAEDLDWCRRFQLAGWTIRYDGRVTAIHVKGAIAGSYRGFKTNWHFHRSMGRFYRKFDAGRNRKIDALVYAAIIGKFAGSAAFNGVRRRLGS